MSSGSKEGATRTLATAMQRLLVTRVRILRRYGVTHAAFVDIPKRSYVRHAARDFHIAGRKQSAARVSVLTRLPRKDVARLLVVADEELAFFGERQSRIARVLSSWRNDARVASGSAWASGTTTTTPMKTTTPNPATQRSDERR